MIPEGRYRMARALALIAATFVMAACQPLTNALTGGNCILSITADGGTSGQQQLSSTNYVAQPFVPQGSGTLTVSSVQLKLLTVTTNSTAVNGTISVYISTDASTSPGVVPTSPSGSIQPTSTNIGTLDASTVYFTQPIFYTINFPQAVTLTAGTVYWLVAYASYSAGGSSYVAWRGNSAQIYSFGQISLSTQGTTWTPSTGDMDALLGCQ